MKREILVCDRCGKEAETTEEKEALNLGEICLGFSSQYDTFQTPQVYPGHQIWRKSWCKSCREELGITKEEIHGKPNVAPKTSLEDLVREIVREEMGGGR